jgi:hypothetical protein
MTPIAQAVSVLVVGVVTFLLGVVSGISLALHWYALGVVALVLGAAGWLATFALGRRTATG